MLAIVEAGSMLSFRIQRRPGRLLISQRALARAVTNVSKAKQRVDKLRDAVTGLTSQTQRVRTQIAVVQRALQPPLDRHRKGQADLETDRLTPSFADALHTRLRDFRTETARAEGFRNPGYDFDSKLAVRAFAAQHGLPVPRMWGPWPEPEDTPFHDLPDRFVLKCTLGAGSVRVYPVVRTDSGFRDLIGGGLVTMEELIEGVRPKRHTGGRYFAEEMLPARGGGPGELPYDVKVFCCYGEPLWLEVRRGAWSRSPDPQLSMRVFAPDGTPLDDARPMQRQDRNVPPPAELGDVISWSQQLSRAVAMPVVRIDFYDTANGLYFGEVTPFPGRTPNHGLELNERFGAAYEAACARWLTDIAAAGSLAPTFGAAAGGGILAENRLGA